MLSRELDIETSSHLCILSAYHIALTFDTTLHGAACCQRAGVCPDVAVSAVVALSAITDLLCPTRDRFASMGSG